MPPEQITVIFGGLFLMAGGLLMTRRIARGRRLCREFAQRLPREYLAYNEPRPAFFYDRRSAAYSAFLVQRKFLQLPDSGLVSQFEAMRREEMHTVMFIFGGFAILALAWLWIEIL